MLVSCGVGCGQNSDDWKGSAREDRGLVVSPSPSLGGRGRGPGAVGGRGPGARGISIAVVRRERARARGSWYLHPIAVVEDLVAPPLIWHAPP
eukprot:6504040-Prymnesium_polylepis.1